MFGLHSGVLVKKTLIQKEKWFKADFDLRGFNFPMWWESFLRHRLQNVWHSPPVLSKLGH